MLIFGVFLDKLFTDTRYLFGTKEMKYVVELNLQKEKNGYKIPIHWIHGSLRGFGLFLLLVGQTKQQI